MLVDAKSKYIRVAPRKVRLVANLVRGMKVDEAEHALQFTVKRSTTPILKLLKSAVANAEHNFNMSKEDLYIAEIRVDGGPIIKRFRPRARGSASPIYKRTSHILLRVGSVSEKPGDDKKKSKKKEKAKIEKVYQEEKPKEEKSIDKKGKKEKGEKESSSIKDKTKDTKGDKKTIFRRKSI